MINYLIGGAAALLDMGVGTCTCARADVAARTPKGPPAAPAVVGMSMEWSGANVLLRSPGFVQMLSNLADADSSGAGPLRIGGNSADTTWWDPNGTKPFDTSCAASYSGQVCVKYAVGPSDIDLHCAAAASVNSSVVYDVSMMQNATAAWAVEEVRGIVAAATAAVKSDRIEAFEVGNEPDLFLENGIRSPESRPEDWVKEQLGIYLPAIGRELHRSGLGAAGRDGAPAKWLQAGTFCCKKLFYAALPERMRALRASGALKSWSQHAYGLSQPKGGPGPPLAELLGEGAMASRIGEFVAPVARAAAETRVPFVVGETNSINMGGERGVSDTAASALWASDWIARLVALGAQRINFHGSQNAPYSWINGWRDGTTGKEPVVTPLYYAMLVMARTLRGGAVPVGVTNRSRVTNASSAVVSHAWVLQDGRRVAIVYKAVNDTKPTHGRYTWTDPRLMPQALGAGAVTAARAVPSGHKRTHMGITGWQRDLRRNTDGRAVGTFTPQQVARGTDGSYSFEDLREAWLCWRSVKKVEPNYRMRSLWRVGCRTWLRAVQRR